MIALKLSGNISYKQWNAFDRLLSYRDEYKAIGGALWLAIESHCKDSKKWTGLQIDEALLENIFCTVSAYYQSSFAP